MEASGTAEAHHQPASLRRCALLRDLDEATLGALTDGASCATYRRGEQIAESTTLADVILAFVAGGAHLLRSSAQGNQVIVDRLDAGDLWGLPLATPSAPTQETLEAHASGTVVWQLRHQQMRKVLLTQPTALLYVLEPM